MNKNGQQRSIFSVNIIANNLIHVERSHTAAATCCRRTCMTDFIKLVHCCYHYFDWMSEFLAFDQATFRLDVVLDIRDDVKQLWHILIECCQLSVLVASSPVNTHTCNNSVCIYEKWTLSVCICVRPVSDDIANAQNAQKKKVRRKKVERLEEAGEGENTQKTTTTRPAMLHAPKTEETKKSVRR